MKNRSFFKTGLFIIFCVGIIISLAFQNCSLTKSDNNNTPSAQTTGDNTQEVNTTAAKSLRISFSKSSAQSGENVDIEVYAENENGSVVTDFNYSVTASVKTDWPTNTANQLSVLFCIPQLKFDKGVLRISGKFINNEYNTDQLISLTLNSTNLSKSLAITIQKPKLADYAQVSTQGGIPKPRRGNILFFDKIKNRLLMFGGQEIYEHVGDVQLGNALNDLWQLDLSTSAPTWREISPSSSPQTRYFHSFAFDSVRKRLLVFGGLNEVGVVSNEMWSFDLANVVWTNLNTQNTPPQARYKHKMAFDSAQQYTFLTDGENGSITNMTAVYTFRSGDSTDGNWLASGQFPTQTSENIPVIHSAKNQTIYFNQFFSEKPYTPALVGCNRTSNAPYVCPDETQTTAFDSLSKNVWVVSSVAEVVAPVVANQASTQYRPVIKVFKRPVPVKMSCE